MSQTLTTSRGAAPRDAPEIPSVLFRYHVTEQEIDSASRPGHFHDLHLDDVAAAVCGKRAGRLESYFWIPLRDAESVHYRQHAIRECERPEVGGPVARYAKSFATVHSGLMSLDQLRYPLQRQRALLDTVGEYCRATQRLHQELGEVPLESAAWSRLRAHLGRLVDSAPFRTMSADQERVRAGLDSVVYSLLVHDNRIKVDRYAGEPDLGAHVVDLFDRFREEPQADAEPTSDVRTGFSHVDAKVLDQVALLFPEPFADLSRFADKHLDFLDPAMARLGREAQLVLAWVDLKKQLADAGLTLCYPTLDPMEPFAAQDVFDLALATGPGGRAASLVTNSLDLADGERLLVVTGPNQGGKTTFARTIGQIHHLASLGFPVPGSAVRLRLVDEVLAHFERAEEPGSERGKLKDDLIRMHEILQRVTPESVVVLNEVFSSTTTADALGLARRVLDRLVDAQCLVVCVTFLDELAAPGPATVSLVAQVDPADPSRRTFEIRRHPADGKAYAAAIAAKYGLAREAIARRVGR